METVQNGAVADVFTQGIDDVLHGRAPDDLFVRGIFLECVKPEGARVSQVNNKHLRRKFLYFSLKIFEGECIPSLKKLKTQFLSEDDNVYPHAWKGGVGCFTLGLAIMVFTVLLALLTPCCRYCLCCSVFTVSPPPAPFTSLHLN